MSDSESSSNNSNEVKDRDAASNHTQEQCISGEEDEAEYEAKKQLKRKQNSTNPWVIEYFVLGMYIRGQGAELFQYCEMDMVDEVKRILNARFSKTFKTIVFYLLCLFATYTIYYLFWLLSLRFDETRHLPIIKGTVQYEGHSIHVEDFEITKFLVSMFLTWIIGIINVITFLEPRLLPTYNDEDDVTALHIAAKFNSLNVAKYLLETFNTKYDLSLTKFADWRNETPFDYAINNKHVRMMALMKPYVENKNDYFQCKPIPKDKNI